MAKKKTLASTKKKPEESRKQPVVEKKTGGLKKLLSKYKQKKELSDKKKKKEEPKTEPVKQTFKPVEAKVEAKKTEPKKEQQPKRERKPLRAIQVIVRNKKKLSAAILISLGVFALFFIGYFLFAKLFSPQALAEILPAEKTLGLFEVNIDSNDSQPKAFFALMQKYPAYQKENLISTFNLALPYSFERDIKPWIGRKIGVALIDTSGKGTSVTAPVFFAESIDHAKTISLLKDHALQSGDDIIESDYNGKKIYTFKYATGLITFVNNYLVYSPGKDTGLNYLDNSNSSRLVSDPDYRKVANNLPQGSLVFGYVNYNKLVNNISADKKFAAEKGQDLLALKPFLNVFKSAGMTVFAESNRFVAQTFTGINNDSLNGGSYITYNDKYQGKLLALAGEDPLFLAGGHDLTKELNRLEEIFTSGTKTPAMVFQGILEAQKQKYFGNEIDLKKDIYPLLTGEYLLSVENSLDEPVYTLNLELTNAAADQAILDRVVTEFANASGIFTPHIQAVTLPDGTQGNEIVAIPEKIEKLSGKYEDHNYTVLKIGETGSSIYTTVLDNIAVFTNSEDALKAVIDRNNGVLNQKLTSTKYFDQNIKPVLTTADELMHVKLGAVTELLKLNDNKFLAPYLVPFTDFTISKNYFTDGISTIYLVDII